MRTSRATEILTRFAEGQLPEVVSRRVAEARTAHNDAARVWGGNNSARADEIVAWISAASATGR